MRLPNAERAVVDVAKLRDYCLSLHHPRGRHKARVFGTAIGITADSADMLRIALLNAALHCEAVPSIGDRHGQRYVLDFEMSGPVGRKTVRSSWIVRTGEGFPRLVTCYVL